jgi:hypothetical protein
VPAEDALLCAGAGNLRKYLLENRIVFVFDAGFLPGQVLRKRKQASDKLVPSFGLISSRIAHKRSWIPLPRAGKKAGKRAAAVVSQKAQSRGDDYE